MLYFFLLVIAIGVLLISPVGKQILKWSVIVAVIGGILFAAMMVLQAIAEYSQDLAIILGVLGVGGILRAIIVYKGWDK